MTTSDELKLLRERINKHRQRIKLFLDELEPKGVRYTWFSIVGSALASILTGSSAALGGESVLDLAGDPVLNRIILLIAAILSGISAGATSLYKQKKIASNLSTARKYDAKLEVLEIYLEQNNIDHKKATDELTDIVGNIKFIPNLEEGKPDEVAGNIYKPKKNKVVGNKIYCSGRVKNMASNLHLWLAVEIDGHIWPKEGEIIVANGESWHKWHKKIYEDGATGSPFSISLYVADDNVNRQIRNWLDECDKSGNYPESKKFPGLVRVDRVSGLHHIY